MEVWLHAFFKLLGGNWLFSLPICFIPTETAPLFLLDKRLDGHQKQIKRRGKIKTCCPCQISNPGSSAIQQETRWTPETDKTPWGN
jgi:hypothetical protein